MRVDSYGGIIKAEDIPSMTREQYNKQRILILKNKNYTSRQKKFWLRQLYENYRRSHGQRREVEKES